MLREVFYFGIVFLKARKSDVLQGFAALAKDETIKKPLQRLKRTLQRSNVATQSSNRRLPGLLVMAESHCQVVGHHDDHQVADKSCSRSSLARDERNHRRTQIVLHPYGLT